MDERMCVKSEQTNNWMHVTLNNTLKHICSSVKMWTNVLLRSILKAPTNPWCNNSFVIFSSGLDQLVVAHEEWHCVSNPCNIPILTRMWVLITLISWGTEFRYSDICDFCPTIQYSKEITERRKDIKKYIYQFWMVGRRLQENIRQQNIVN